MVAIKESTNEFRSFRPSQPTATVQRRPSFFQKYGLTESPYILPYEESKWGVARSVLAELLGTMFFVFVAGLSVYPALVNVDGGGIVTLALSSGFAFSILVASTCRISGGHLNPAVTLGVFLAGAIHPVLAAMHVLAQMVGAVFGSLMAYGVLGYDKFEDIRGGTHALTQGVTAGQGILAELMFTAILVAVVLFTFLDDQQPTKEKMTPWAAGCAVGVGVLAGAHGRGAGMNPAHSFGPALIMTCIYGNGDIGPSRSSIWEDHYVFWVGPILGSMLAVGIFKLYDWLKTRPEAPPATTSEEEASPVVPAQKTSSILKHATRPSRTPSMESDASVDYTSQIY